MKTIAIGVGENENIIQACHIFKEKHPKTDIRLIYSDEDLVKAVLNDNIDAVMAEMVDYADGLLNEGKAVQVGQTDLNIFIKLSTGLPVIYSISFQASVLFSQCITLRLIFSSSFLSFSFLIMKVGSFHIWSSI